MNKMTAWLLAAGGLAGATGVMIGAFAAHALQASLDAKALGWVETGVRYQMIHAVALIALAALSHHRPSRLLAWSGIAWSAGILLFAGSLFILAMVGWRPIVFATPVGGVMLVAGWVLLIAAAFRPRPAS